MRYHVELIYGRGERRRKRVRETNRNACPPPECPMDEPPPPSEIVVSPGHPRLSLLAARIAVPVGLLLVSWAGFVILSREPEKKAVPPAPPQTIRTRAQKPQARDFQVVVKTHGVVRAHNESTLSSLVSGRVARVSPCFEDGGFFAKGEVVVELEADDYRTALAIADARLLGAKASLQLARVNHDRNTVLLQGSLVSQTEADLTESSLAQATAEVNSAKAQLEKAERDLERTQIRAPFDGCVRKRTVGLGQLVSPGTALGVVFSIDFVEVRLPIAARERRFLDLPGFESIGLAPAFSTRDGNAAGRLEPRASAPIEVELRDAIDRDSKQVWKARIVRTEGALDENSLELFAIAQVQDPFGRRSGQPPLRIGQPVTARIRGNILTNVVALPRMAVRELDRILLVDQASLTLLGRRITPIWSDEDHIFIQNSPMLAGALVATTHLVYAPDGARVELITEIDPALATAGSNSPPAMEVTQRAASD